jgi:molybdopterin-guanine dinucleotide biosynthesis protein
LIASPPTAPVPPASAALRPKAFAIVGTSNSGKTELICRLLEWFGNQGLKVAVLKHSHHQQIGDLILVEGYKTSDLPKVGLAPPDAASPLPDYPRLLAWVSPRPLPTRLPVFHPLEVAAIGRFIQDQLGGR